ncbi:MAG TPA: cobyrinate a,c-diamide synthase [Polyangiaceae bacterium]|jgi:cobyrinic acid a,c-diamide synthase
MNVPRLLLAGASSGAGKTTCTVAIARALRARGLRVALFKCGPDYLDPTYHARAIAGPSHTLDGWMMGKDAVLSTFARATHGEGGAVDLALIEGVMGLFDGASPTSDEGSSAEIAKWLGAPVVTVIDAGGMARTVAAVAHGLATFDPEVRVGGVIANRVGSRGHLDLLKKALREPPLFGGFPRDAAPAFPERHLGLRTASEDAVPEALFDRWGALAEEWLGLDALLALARSAPPLEAPVTPVRAAKSRPCRIGVAWDAAFHFYYEENLRLLESLGATLVRFSPVNDRALPDVSGLYLGGGYPEVHAAQLADNGAMREAIVAFAERGAPIYAECGGLMYLTRAIRTIDGASHPMVGLFEGEAVVHDRLQALGYVEVETQERSLLGEPGLRFRGHQFRYSELVAPGDAPRAYSIRRRRGGETEREGFARGNVLASYVHAHWASNPRAAEGFVAACADFGAPR